LQVPDKHRLLNLTHSAFIRLSNNTYIKDASSSSGVG
jgi:hypothetical protein